MFTLARNGQGLYIDLNSTPDHILDKLIEWSEEAQENEKFASK